MIYKTADRAERPPSGGNESGTAGICKIYIPSLKGILFSDERYESFHCLYLYLGSDNADFTDFQSAVRTA